MEVRALRESDDRSQFTSGDPDLDRFFHKFAGPFIRELARINSHWPIPEDLALRRVIR
jgi:hypothetical protein